MKTPPKGYWVGLQLREGNKMEIVARAPTLDEIITLVLSNPNAVLHWVPEPVQDPTEELCEALVQYLNAGHKDARRAASVRAKEVLLAVKGLEWLTQHLNS